MTDQDKHTVEVDIKDSNVQGNVNVAGRDNIFKTVTNNITNFLAGDTDQQRAFRNRKAMLSLVWDTWIEGVLKKSLYNEVLIELGMETRPDAVEHPWDMLLQMPEQEPRQIPHEARMLDLFDAMNGSMLILGEPGSGKTTMLLELCRQAIERAEVEPTQPIPVVFNLSSWTPKRSLTNWLVEELRHRYYIPKKIAQTWVDNDELMVLLDGLDEVSGDYRPAIVPTINGFVEEHKVPLSVCSRRQEYEQLGTHLKLRGAILIQPLTSQQVAEYLLTTGVDVARIFQALHQDEELQDFAQTPLILSILVLSYRDATDNELRVLAEAKDFRSRLFDTYIAQMFKRRGFDEHFPSVKSKAWLSWLARRMLGRQQTIFFVEDIQPNWLSWHRRIYIRLISALIIGGIGWLISGLFFKFYWFLIWGFWKEFFIFVAGYIGSVIGILIGGKAYKPVDKLSWSWRKYWRSSIFWMSIWMIVWSINLTNEINADWTGNIGGHLVSWHNSKYIWLIGGLICGLIGSVFGGLRGSILAQRELPGTGIRTSKKAC